MATRATTKRRERSPASGSPRKRQTWQEGRVLAIPLGRGRTGFGQIVNSTEIDFFDVENGDSVDAHALALAAVAFRVPVMRSAVTSGEFSIIGHAEVPESRKKHGMYFRQDSDTGEFFVSSNGGVSERHASASEVADMECAAVWSAEHIVDRLRDHFDRVPNKWVASLRPNATGRVR